MVSLLSLLFSWLIQRVSHRVNSSWISNSIKFYVIFTQKWQVCHYLLALMMFFYYLLYGKDLCKHYLKHLFMVLEWHEVNNEFSFLGELYLYFILKLSHACLLRLVKYLWIQSNNPMWVKYGDANTVFYISISAAVRTELSSHFC